MPRVAIASLKRPARYLVRQLREASRQVRIYRVRRNLRRYPKPFRVHLGCGTVHLEGWLNTDARESDAVDILWDVTDGMPFQDEECEFIYSEHMLEHLDIRQGLFFLRECRRALSGNGVFRVAMPSLDRLIERCYLGNWRDADWLSWPEYQFIATRAEMFNYSIRGGGVKWGHKWLYDREELHRRLKEAGFGAIIDCEFGQSDVPELRGLERRMDSLLVCEARR